MKWLRLLLRLILWSITISAVVSAIAVTGIYFYLEPKLPSTRNLKEVEFQVPLRIYSRDHKLLAEFGEKRRIPLSYAELPDMAIQAFLAAEDSRFFEHPGVDYQGILRAAIQLLLTGEKRQGGSTITMQVARNFFLSREKTYTRKLNEILLALKIERNLSKQEILELYLNKIYMGHRAYGVGAAAQVYYGKSVDQLDLPQFAMIAGLPKAPSRFNPITDPERARDRRNYVLERMQKLGFITPDEYQQARLIPVSARLHAANLEVEAPYMAEMVRAEMMERFGDNTYTNGYSVFTTLDSRLQTSANAAVRKALREYEQRHGYRGPEKHLAVNSLDSDQELTTLLAEQKTIGDLLPAIVTEVHEKSIEAYLGQGQRIEIDWDGLNWAQPYINENRKGSAPKQAESIVTAGDLIRVVEQQKGDKPSWRLSQIPTVAGALISMDPDNGGLVAVVGGYDFYSSKFNRAIQAKRQPGSGFKAFIYSAALEAGFTAASLINDAPVVFDDPSLERAWRPENYSGKFYGPTRLRYALIKSRNLVSIRLLRSMGIDHALKHIALFGFDPDLLPHNLSLALGSGAVTLLQMATGYSILANGGFRVEPYFIERIEDSQHDILFQANPMQVCEGCGEIPSSTEEDEEPTVPIRIAPRVISPQNHYLMNSMMRDVITQGTARKALELGRQDLAGKTGTTNDQKDAWFCGFNRSLVAVTWVGFDTAKPLGRGEVGGKAALPAWMAYMKDALQDIEEIPLKMPSDMITVRIDPGTGKRARINQKNAIFEVFREENALPELGQGEASTTAGADIDHGGGEDEDPF